MWTAGASEEAFLRAALNTGGDGLSVERLDDDVVFRLIDRWIQNTKKKQDIAVVSFKAHEIRE